MKLNINKKGKDMVIVALLMLVIVFSWWQIIELSMLKNYVISIGDVSPRLTNKILAVVASGPLDATYSIDGRQVTLKNGVAEEAVVPGSAANRCRKPAVSRIRWGIRPRPAVFWLAPDHTHRASRSDQRPLSAG